MKKYLFIFISLLSISNANAQSGCLMINSANQAKAGTVTCGNIHDYSAYPDNPYTPIKFVRVSFDLFQKADGTGSFNASDAIIKSYFQAFVDSVNYRLGNIQKNNPATTSPKVIDSKIRIILNNTYIYKNDNLFNYVAKANTTYSNGNTSTTRLTIISDSIYYKVIQPRTDLSTIDKSNTLHVLLFPQSNKPFGGMAKDISNKEWIYLRGYDDSFNNAYGGVSQGFGLPIREVVGHFTHELCHSLGLYHNFQDTVNGDYQCTKDWDKIVDAGCPYIYTSNNYMDYTWPSRNRTALSEDQIAKIHYCLMGNSGTIQDDMITSFCNYNFRQPVSINSGQNIVWNSSKNLLGDLLVNSNGTLTVKCNISVSHGGKVIINSGGKLIDQGNFKNYCNDEWDGIEVLNGGYLELNTISIADYNIKVKAGGSIRINGNLTMTGNHSITVESGGYICIEPSYSIKLTDFNSVINLKCGYINGVNSSITGITKNCVASPAGYVTTGYGKINAASFANDVYIQNDTLTGNRYITGKNIYIGNNVTTTKAQGPVYLSNGANIIFNACNEIIEQKEFYAPPTSKYEFINH